MAITRSISLCDWIDDIVERKRKDLDRARSEIVNELLAKSLLSTKK